MGVKGVIVAAGYGTRFLPVTRVVPKELLPLVDRPALDVVVQEMADAGIEDLLVITSRRKRAVEDWFDHDAELEAVFRAEGATAKLARAQPTGMRVQFVRQRHMGGTGHALLLARTFAGDDPVVVAYPDDLFTGANCTAELIDTWRATGHTVLSAQDLTGEDVSRYGVLDASPEGAHWRVRGIVEKPPAGAEPSSLVSLGRYLYTPEVFPLLAAGIAKHPSGEFYPMDAINSLAAQGRVVARTTAATRHDTGAPLGYLQAVVHFGLAHPDHGDAFRAWLATQAG